MTRARPSARPALALLLATMAVTLWAAAPTPTALRDLVTAARTGDVAGVKTALASGADVNDADPTYSQTALMRAAMFAQPGTTAALLAAHASTAATSDGARTALHWAAIGGSGEVVRLLAQAGARVDALDGYDETPLGFALQEGRPEAVRALLTAGAQPERLHRPIAEHLGMVLGNGETGGRLEALRQVIRSRRGLEATTDSGRTALLEAAEWAHRDNSADLARELLAAGANPKATAKDGSTALQAVQARVREGSSSPAFTKNLAAMLAVLEGRQGMR